MNFPDHPVIQNTERTGYACGREPALPRCPFCGRECVSVYENQFGECVGCDRCVRETDAWKADICFPAPEEDAPW